MGKSELNIDADLLADAQSAGVPVEKVVEDALRAALRAADLKASDARATAWAQENAAAIAEYNSRIAEHGVFSDGLRTW